MSQQREQLLSQGPFISNDPETSGFDLSSGSKWIYPENFPRRDYQFSIVQTALYNNTLVCLPTGLGKTFIAAVIMYNFWRWYPRGKVVFMAPTKPLVAQQINACHEIMGIPGDQTIELTGAVNQTKRKQAWTQKRVIFATPQTFQKDLQNDYVPCELIKCVVIDEAHKALGKHSYCEIIRMLNEKNKFFRVLALSATPGSKLDQVREVIQNLLISELELRDDTSPDITPYTNDRLMEKVIVTLDKDLRDFKDRYVSIMDPHVRILVKNRILQTNAADISKGRIFMLMKQLDSRPQRPQNYGIIMKTLNILLSMYHAYELLLKHGLRAFYNFYANHSEKFWLESELELQLLIEDVKRFIGEFPVISASPDEPIPEIPNDLVFGHSKFKKLQELLVQHFRSFSDQNKSTRAIVFVEYRDIVNEVFVLLLQTRPLIRPQMFVGQAGQKQKQQLAALEDFRNNKVNVLISTSVGEEGLDVGEVDLIVCFDISTSTPTRLVQRMGRTGRKRNGRVVLLLTEGKEVLTLNQALSKKDSLNNKVLQSSNITSSLYQSSPRMVPSNITPECFCLYIKSLPKTPKGVGKNPREKAQVEKKPPGEKKPRKKKNAAFVGEEVIYEPSTSAMNQSKLLSSQSKLPSSSQSKQPSSSQSSMMKYLTGNQQPKKVPSLWKTSGDDSGILLDEFQSTEARRTNMQPLIKPSEVKLLSSDSHAVEFLTLCAMKKSEQQAESTDHDIGVGWLAGSPPPLKYDISEFQVPRFDDLDWIAALNPYEESKDVDSEVTWTADEICSRRESNFFGDVRDEEVQFEDEFEVVHSKYAHSNTQEKVDRVEVMDSDFLDEFDLQVPQPQCPEPSTSALVKSGSTTPDIEVLELADLQDDFDKASLQRTPARVEVDFADLLNEGSESEASTSQALIAEDGNIFDDLLEEASSDEEEFAEVTVVDTTIRAKRGASPSAGSTPKRQRLSQSSDDAVLATPTKPRTSLSRLQELREGTLEAADEATIKEEAPSTANDAVSDAAPNLPNDEADDDSDKDLFDDIEFETQFTFAIKKEPRVKSEVSLKTDTNKSLSFKETEVVHKEKNVDATTNMEFDDISILQDDFVDNLEEMQDSQSFDIRPNRSQSETHVPKSVSQNEYSQSKQKSVNLEKLLPMSRPSSSKEIQNVENLVSKSTSTPNKDIKKIENLASKSTSIPSKEVQKVENLASKSPPPLNKDKNTNDLNLEDYDIDGWTDDFDFAPMVVPKKPSQETSSGFFKKPEASSSSGWISVKEKKPLSLKNLRPPDDPHVMRVQGFPRPNLGLLSLRQKPEVSRDKDGFALPVQISPRRPPPGRVPCRNKENTPPKRRTKKKRSRRVANEFLDDEAEVSDDVDTSEGSSDEGEYAELGSFVSYTQDVSDAVDMRAHYLQTVNKSPVNPGAFMFKEVRRHVPDHEVFSQPMSQVDDHYEQDSFCVEDATQAIELDDSDSENESILESNETILGCRRQKMRRKKELLFQKLKSKRKNSNVQESSSSETGNTSSEDETEALRKQILEESMVLKTLKR